MPKKYRMLDDSETLYQVKIPTSYGYTAPTYRCKKLPNGDKYKNYETIAVDLDELTFEKL